MGKKLTLAACLAVIASSIALAQGEKKSSLADTLMRRENQMLAALQKKDFATFKKDIKGNAWNVDENGYMSLDDFLKAVADPKAGFTWDTYAMNDTKVVTINATTALVTYKLDQKGSFMGQAFPSPVYATTVWSREGGAWTAVFHQESTAAQQKK